MGASRGGDGEARTDATGQLHGGVGTGKSELARDPRSLTALSRLKGVPKTELRCLMIGPCAGESGLARDPRSPTALSRLNDGHVSVNAKKYSSK